MGFLNLLQAVYGLLTSIVTWSPFEEEHEITKKPVCHLLQLPVELIHHISDDLSPASRLVLSQTCRPLGEILRRDALANPFTREYRCEYLAAIARQRPDYWVCEVCVRLHKVDTSDTPEKPCVQTCSAGRKRWRQTGYGQQDRLDARLLRIDHRHIQLALKYTRLKCRNYQDYLDNLLVPRIETKFGTHLWPYRQPNVLSVHYSAFPKIVVGDDGNLRFLLLSSWRYEVDTKSITIPAMGDLKICPHLRLTYGARRGIGHEIGSLKRILSSFLPREGMDNKNGFYFCCYCPTDLCVKTSRARLILSAWQDLGPEGSPMDKSWRVHILGNPMISRGHPHLSHEPGSVLRLYEQTKGVGYLPL
ncbi:uncharacterized protein GGS22DRAFT_16995 [Annulohypoxylon maeteangense]|uniref:uncharacterized protein n=1 Tax=Annulohypoxylon maeteangense TaxID=1927788 RepID=UPI00200792F8|nr:uncharacterized protein GGS22DRAFT_16995 [Annulohypoxylon maeteangense]KAI0890682.1 hypothetical protein GGS22DRAFT_16995 [Annulohypoxylon maeteangense]